MPSFTEHSLFHGSCWVPGTKGAPVPRGVCGVRLTLNVRKRRRLNMTARGPHVQASSLVTPSTLWAPQGLCTSCSECMHRYSSSTPMFSMNSFLSDFISHVTSPEEASHVLRLNEAFVFCALLGLRFSLFPLIRALIGGCSWICTGAAVRSMSSYEL